jgi:hypothetical protein
MPMRVLLVLGLVLALGSPLPAQEEPPKLSPFSAIETLEESLVEVRLGNERHRLLAIDGRPVDDVLAYCRRMYAEKWKKRFAEDLVEVLWGMGKDRAERAADLTVAGPDGPVVMRGVPMTEANRAAVKRGREERIVNRVSRERGAAAPGSGALTHRVFEDSTDRLTRAKAEQDLDQLEWHLTHEHSYSALEVVPGGTQYRGRLDSIRAALGESISRKDFEAQVAAAVGASGDGHAIYDAEPLSAMSFAPFLCEHTGDGLIAFKADRSGFLADGHPVITAIDGVAVDRWLAASLRTVPRGSEALTRSRSGRGLRNLGYLRRELGLEARGGVEVELASTDGAAAIRVSIPLAARPPRFGDWPAGRSRMLEGGIGYLRLAEMAGEASAVLEAQEWMTRFTNAPGIIIDVRGNGGGTRDLTRALVPVLTKRGEGPRVCAAAVYRLRPGQRADAPEGYLAGRSMFPAAATRWTAEERAAIERFAERFRPEVAPDPAAFSAWHYFVSGAGTGTGRPVVVLMDEGCFSATDVFLASVKGLPGVTLVGQPSSGGSGYTDTIALEHSGMRLRLSTMASFTRDGRLFDGRGIAPDVVVERAATDLIGQSDAALARAIEIIAAGR